jgi:hypothetical protein
MTGGTSPYFDPPPPPARATGWTGSDLLILTSLVVLLVALFMPWFSGTVHLGSRVLSAGGADGPRAHGYLWFVFVLALIALVVLVARDAISRIPGELPSPAQMLVVATGLALLLTILGAVVRPSPEIGALGPSGAIAPFPLPIGISIGWSYGGFIAIAAGAVAFVASLRQAGPLTSGRRLLRMPSRSPDATT